jgi:hypothetical protein
MKNYNVDYAALFKNFMVLFFILSLVVAAGAKRSWDDY